MSFGMHVSKAGRKNTKKSRPMAVALQQDMAFMEGFNIGKPSAQIFVCGPQTYAQTLSADDKAAIRRYVDETGLSLVIHGAYVDIPWSQRQQAIGNIMEEMRIAYQIGATGVVVHLGNSTNNSIEFVLNELGRLEQTVKESTMLWLETNSVRASANSFETPEKIRALFEKVKLYNVHSINVGLCVDTAHLFACGVSLDTYDKAKQWFTSIPDVPLMLHLNDSGSKLGSGKDLHESLCYGEIWRVYHPETGILPIEQSGLAYIVEMVHKKNIVAILERDDEVIINDFSILQHLAFTD